MAAKQSNAAKTRLMATKGDLPDTMTPDYFRALGYPEDEIEEMVAAWTPANTPPPWCPTIAVLRAAILDRQRHYADGDSLYIFMAKCDLVRFRDAARRINGAIPLPPSPEDVGSDPERGKDALDALLGWLNQVEAATRATAPGGPQRELAAPAITHAGDEKPTLSKEAVALAVLQSHPEWTDTQIATAAGCSRTSLYRWPLYQQAREILATGKASRPHGSKSKDGHIDAWAADAEE
jgi:hypothetical protein